MTLSSVDPLEKPMLLNRRRRAASGRTIKDRILNLVLLLLFLTAIAGTGYLILKIMTKWTVEGLG